MKLKLNKLIFIIFALFLICGILARKKRDLKENSFTTYIQTILSDLNYGKVTEVQLKECIPTLWIKDNDGETKKSAQKIIEEFLKNFNTLFVKLDPTIDRACAFKSETIEQLMRSNKIVLLEKKSTVQNQKKIQRKSRRFEPITGIVSDNSFLVFTALKDFLKSELFVTTRVTLQCFQTSNDTSAEFKTIITRFLTSVKQLQQDGKEGFIKVIVEALCNWTTFREALVYLGKSNLETEEMKRWANFGRFLAKFIKTFACPINLVVDT